MHTNDDDRTLVADDIPGLAQRDVIVCAHVQQTSI